MASSVFSAAVQVAGSSGVGLAWLAIGVGGLVCVLAAWNFAELCAAFPNAGGVSVYVREAFGPSLSLTVSLLYVVLAWAAGAAEAYVFAAVLSVLFRGVPVLSQVPPVVWVLATLGFFFVINLRGVELAGRVQDAMTYTMFGVLLLVSLAAWVLPARAGAAVGLAASVAASAPSTATATGTTGAAGLGFGSFLQAIAYSVYLFIGFEWITPLVEEAEDRMYLPRAMPLAVLGLAVSYALFAEAMAVRVPLPQLAQSATPHLLYGQAIGGSTGLLVLVGVSFLATFTSFNAGMMGTSRLVYAMAREGVLPKALSHVHLTYFTPWSALLFMFLVEAALSVALLYSGQFTVPILLAAAIESTIYALAALALVKLRRSQPNLERPYRAPGGTRQAVITAVVFAALALGVLLPPTPVAVPVGFAVGLVGAWLYARFVAPVLSERNG